MGDSVSGAEDCVKVAIRCRPLSSDERVQGHANIIQIDQEYKTINVKPLDKQEPPKSYTFDDIFGESSSQITIYNTIARRIVDNVLVGYNGCIFAYGQTGTGKTYTMTGNTEVDEEKGIIPNSFAHIFDHIAHCAHNKTFLVRVSFMEIYNEEIRDLLQKPRNQRSLEIKERFDIGVYVKDLTSVAVSTADQCFQIMQFGTANRQTGQTAMNEQSSRSHAIFTLIIECSEKIADDRTLFRLGKLHLVDLAGSERQSKTHSVGDRLKEASKINLSLSTLGNVISSLVDSKSTHIPYRNSKLTRLLQDSLGGNSKTLMIANIGPASYNYEETISTLRYANRAKNITNVVRINEDPKDALLRRFQEEIESLRKQLEDGELSESSEGEDQGQSPKVSNEDHPHFKEANYSEHIRAMEEEIERGRLQLQKEHGMKETERRKLAEILTKKEEELAKTKNSREKLTKKLASIEKKLIVGGENMLKKAGTQAKLLEESKRELEKAQQNEMNLHQRLKSQQAERQDIEQKYSSLQEESQNLSKQLKKVYAQNIQLKAELRDVETEHQREMEALLENVRQIHQKTQFLSMAIDHFIPVEKQKLIEKNIHWNDESGEWQLKCIAYTGNNMRDNRQYIPTKFKSSDPQMKPIHASYADLLGTSNSPYPTASASISPNPTVPASANGANNQQIKAATNFRPKSAAKDRNAAKIRALLE